MGRIWLFLLRFRLLRSIVSSAHQFSASHFLSCIAGNHGERAREFTKSCSHQCWQRTGARVLPFGVVPVLRNQKERSMFRLVPLSENRTRALSLNGVMFTLNVRALVSGHRAQYKRLHTGNRCLPQCPKTRSWSCTWARRQRARTLTWILDKRVRSH